MIKMRAELNSATEEESGSSYLQYLPAIYKKDEFAGRFLRIFEDILQPIEGLIDNLPYYLDPGVTPEPFLPWLASWLGLALDERWPIHRRRRLVASAVELYQWRGTRRGLSQFLTIYTGVTPQIAESRGRAETSLGSSTKLGVNTYLSGGGGAFGFVVTIRVEDLSKIDISTVRAIIEIQKPAYTTYSLNLVGKGPTEREEQHGA
jgi:phage tail-like protein